MKMPDWALELNNDLAIAELYHCSVQEVRRLDFREYNRALIYNEARVQADKIKGNPKNTEWEN